MEKHVLYRCNMYPWHWVGKSTFSYLASFAVPFIIGAAPSFLFSEISLLELIGFAPVLVVFTVMPLLISHRWCIEVSRNEYDMGEIEVEIVSATFERIPGLLSVFDRKRVFIPSASFHKERCFFINKNRGTLCFRVNEEHFEIDKLPYSYKRIDLEKVVFELSQHIKACDEKEA